MAENRKHWIYPEIRETEKPTLFYLEDNRVSVLTHITEMDVQNLFYKWFFVRNGKVYERTLPTAELATHLCAELAHALVTKGYPVGMPTLQTQKMVQNASYTPEPECIVTTNTNASDREDNLCIRYKGIYGGIADALQAIPHAVGRGTEVVFVSLRYFQEVLDFALTYGVHITPEAKELIAMYKEIYTEALFLGKEAPRYVSPTIMKPKYKWLGELVTAEVVAELLDD